MAQGTNTGQAGNTAVPEHGDHDRVVMLSLKADGTPDQHNPEIIGDKDFALEATKRQFTEQAVSAADVAARGATTDTGAETVGQDPAIEHLQQVHQAAEQDAVSAAERTVDALYTGETDTTGSSSTPSTSTSTRPAEADSSKTARK
jgi:hypothetical protein